MSGNLNIPNSENFKVEQRQINIDDRNMRRIYEGMPYGPEGAARELMDNSISSAIEDSMQEVRVNIVVNIDPNNPENSSIHIIDNAAGIRRNPGENQRGINDALGMTNPSEMTSGRNNKYGFGLKGAGHNIGDFHSIVTQPKYEKYPYMVRGEWQQNFDIRVFPSPNGWEHPFGADHGTMIVIDNLTEKFWYDSFQGAKSAWKHILGKLEAIYAHALDGTRWSDVKLNSNLTLNFDGEEAFSKDLEAAWPPMYDYDNEEPRPDGDFSETFVVESGDIKATVRIGYAPDEDAYEDAVQTDNSGSIISNPWYDKHYHPYTKAGVGGAGITHQGFDHVYEGRGVGLNKLFEMEVLDKQPNSGYNLCTGEIIFHDGIEVQTIKEGIQEDKRFKRLFDAIQERIEEGTDDEDPIDPEYFVYTQRSGQTAEDVVEAWLRDGCHLGNVQEIERSPVVNSREGDILAKINDEGTVIEVKSSNVKADHVDTALMYAQMFEDSGSHIDVNRVILVGSSSTRGAKKTRDYINENVQGYQVVLMTHKQLLSSEYERMLNNG